MARGYTITPTTGSATKPNANIDVAFAAASETPAGGVAIIVGDSVHEGSGGTLGWIPNWVYESIRDCIEALQKSAPWVGASGYQKASVNPFDGKGKVVVANVAGADAVVGTEVTVYADVDLANGRGSSTNLLRERCRQVLDVALEDRKNL